MDEKWWWMRDRTRGLEDSQRSESETGIGGRGEAGGVVAEAGVGGRAVERVVCGVSGGAWFALREAAQGDGAVGARVAAGGG